MGDGFNKQSLSKARKYAEVMREKMSRLKGKAEEQIGNSFQVAEVSATSFAFGYANGRWGEDGEVKVLGLPVDLGVGFALTGIAMFGGLGKYEEHGINVGSGALAAFGYRSGFQLGEAAAAEGAKLGKKSASRRTAELNGAVKTTWDGQAQGQPVTVHERT